MLNQKIVSLLNKQVNNEFFSAYLYLDFSNYYEHKGLKGFANWFRIQAKEELDHGMLMYQYLHNNNELVALDTISRPNKTYENLEAPLKMALAHECGVTASINEIYQAAEEVKDYRTMQFLDWFVKEQGEEEANTHELISKMELFGGDSRALYLLDSDLGSRTYTAPDMTL